MEKILKEFPHATKRDYKGGVEIRVKNLDDSLIRARQVIAKEQLPIEIFEICSPLRSFSIRPLSV
ncbi:MAG: hypothetical protein ACTJHT_15440 [Sphingobacterium sp.]